MSFNYKIDANRRIKLPESFLRQYQLEKGNDLIVEITGSSLEISIACSECKMKIDTSLIKRSDGKKGAIFCSSYCANQHEANEIRNELLSISLSDGGSTNIVAWVYTSLLGEGFPGEISPKLRVLKTISDGGRPADEKVANELKELNIVILNKESGWNLTAIGKLITRWSTLLGKIQTEADILENYRSLVGQKYERLRHMCEETFWEEVYRTQNSTFPSTTHPVTFHDIEHDDLDTILSPLNPSFMSSIHVKNSRITLLGGNHKIVVDLRVYLPKRLRGTYLEMLVNRDEGSIVAQKIVSSQKAKNEEKKDLENELFNNKK